MALLGIYVGVIPVALGMLWLPWLRRVPPPWLRGLMALTIGLLAFLAVDATLEGSSWRPRARRRSAARRWCSSAAVVAYLLLTGVSAWLGRRAAAGLGAAGRDRHRPAQPRRGRGHRLRLRGRRAGARRVPGVGFALHNTTEGLAIVAPIAQERASLRRAWPLSGLIAGAPGGARRLDRRGRLQRVARRVPVRLRRRRDRPGHRQLVPAVRDDDGPRAASGRRAGMLGGMASDVRDRLLVAA